MAHYDETEQRAEYLRHLASEVVESRRRRKAYFQEVVYSANYLFHEDKPTRSLRNLYTIQDLV